MLIFEFWTLHHTNARQTKSSYHGPYFIYSRVHISSDEVFSKILKKPSIVRKKMIPHMKAFSLFNKMKQKKKITEKKN